MGLFIGGGAFSFPDALSAALSAARPTDYLSEDAAIAATMPPLAANQRGVIITVTVAGMTTAYLKVPTGLLPIAGNSYSMNWVTVTLAATINGSKVVAIPIPVRPVREPVVLYPFSQNVGTLEDSFYWSAGPFGAGQVPVPTPPTNGKYIPNANDYLIVNPQSHPAHPGWLGMDVPAGDPITIIY